MGVEKRLSTPYGKRSIYLLLETEIDLSWGKDFLHSEGLSSLEKIIKKLKRIKSKQKKKK